MKYTNDNPIVRLSFEFAKLILLYTGELERLKKFSLARQLFNSGTSIGANVREAQNAESKADFIHKMKVAAKEADETSYWLELSVGVPDLPPQGDMPEKLQVIQKILNKIIGSSKRGGN